MLIWFPRSFWSVSIFPYNLSTLTGYSEWTVFTTQRTCISWQNIVGSAKLSQASNHDSHWWLGLLHFCHIVSNHKYTLLTFWLQFVNLNFTLRLACNTWFSYNIVILSTILWYCPCTTLTSTVHEWLNLFGKNRLTEVVGYVVELLCDIWVEVVTLSET